MSEEILKALMKLFAIIAKQDADNSDAKDQYVRQFLITQIKSDNVDEYFGQYHAFLHEDDEKDGEEGKRKLVSVKDSVRTLGICKKINKTLTQKQKVVVLVRLMEFLQHDQEFNTQHTELLDTVSNVFNIDRVEYKLLENLVRGRDFDETELLQCLFVQDKVEEHASAHQIISEGLHGKITLIQIAATGLFFMRYDGESEITLNGQIVPVKSIQLFAPGSTIRLPRGTVFYSDVVSRFMQHDFDDTITFTAEIEEHRFPNGKVALREVDMAEKSGTLVGLMGASGAGKTTLLNILSGLESPSKGVVEVNGHNLHKEYTSIKGIIGYIPQDDLLIEELTVFQNLYFNAQLCFRNMSKKQLTLKVLKTLSELGLEGIRDVKVGNVLNKKISGGQRKRLNIALELIREPAILFVDEPTSGLSSRDSENVMDLLKELSLMGRLIFVVIHQPSSDIYKMFDKLLLLDTGGYPIYYGNPIEAIIYFKEQTKQINSRSGECVTCGNVNPELLFNIIEARVVDDYGNYLPDRKVSPEKWFEWYRENTVIMRPEPEVKKIGNKLRLPTRFKQFAVFIKRDVLSKISNRQYLMINLLEAPVLALLLGFIVRYVDESNAGSYHYIYNENIPAFLFMGIVVALFIGLTVSAEEIFKDLRILKREQFLNLSRMSYLWSKIVILFFLSAFQSFTYVLIGNQIVELKGMLLENWLLLFSVSCFANVLGLNISSAFNSAVTIYILIPLIIIPQMILGGAMFSFDKINEKIGGGYESPLVADLMVSRWAYEAMMVHQFSHNPFQKKSFEVEKELSRNNYKMVYYLPKLDEIADESMELKPGQKLTENLTLLRNELTKECERLNQQEDKQRVRELTSMPFSEVKAEQLKNITAKLNDHYVARFGQAEALKENYLKPFTTNPDLQTKYEAVRKKYFNENLSDLVTGSLRKTKIVREKNTLIQNIDPIYMDTKPGAFFSLRTHFYIAEKVLFGKKLDTFYFNIIIIWGMSLLFFITLYFDVLRKVLNLFKSRY